MENDFSIQLLEKKLMSVPEDVQFALVSPNTAKTLQRIADNYGLSEKEAEELFEEVGLVMLGITNPVNFMGNLAGRIPDVMNDKLKQIAESVNHEIFGPIKPSLAKIHNVEGMKQPGLPAAEERVVLEGNRSTIWHAVSQIKPEQASSLINEYAIKDLQNEKMKNLERMTELNNKMHEDTTKNPTVIETYRAESLAVQNKISDIDNRLRELRKNVPVPLKQ